MKSEMSSLDLYYLAKELKVLEDTKVDRIYHSKEDHKALMIAIHKSGEGKKFLKIALPSLVYIQEAKEEYGTPTGLCMMLRKNLEGAILKKISQKNFERALELKFESKKGKEIFVFRIIIELFSKGNIVFCDNEYKILNLLEDQHWTDRELKKDEAYKFPKSKHDALKINEEEFRDILTNSDRESVVKAIAIEFSLGGLYAEEICFISEIDKNEKVSALDKNQIKILYKEFKGLFEREPCAVLTSKGIFPFKLKSSANDCKEQYANFNEAISKNTFIADKEQESKKKEMEKLSSIIEGQKKTLREAEKGYEDNQNIGHTIYERYKEIDDVLKAIKSARIKYSWKEIKEKITSDEKYSSIIKDIDEQNSEITLILK